MVEESKMNSEAHENEDRLFLDKWRMLLPGAEIEEPAEMFEARKAVLEALKMRNQAPDLLATVWREYALVCEQA